MLNRNQIKTDFRKYARSFFTNKIKMPEDSINEIIEKLSEKTLINLICHVNEYVNLHDKTDPVEVEYNPDLDDEYDDDEDLDDD
jgi:hypothetical protein